MSPTGPFANDPQHVPAADGGHQTTDGTERAENGSRSSPGARSTEDELAVGEDVADDTAADDPASTFESVDDPGRSDDGPGAGPEVAPEGISTSRQLPWQGQPPEPGAPVPAGGELAGPAPRWLPSQSGAPDPDDPTLQSPFPDRDSRPEEDERAEGTAPPPRPSPPPIPPPPAEVDPPPATGEQPAIPAPQRLPDPVTSVETGPLASTSQTPRSPLSLTSLTSFRRPSSRPPARHRARQPLGDGRIVNERIRHVSPRSVLKISAIFYSCVALALLVATVLVWSFARTTGTVEDIESFVTQLFTYGHCVSEDELELGADFRESDQCPSGVMVGSFEIDDGALFRSAFLGAILFVAAATIGTVFMVLLFNLLSDLTGGVRYSIVREPMGTSKSSTGGAGRR